MTKVFFVMRFFFAERLFFVARFFCVTGTMVPIPIPCVPIFLCKPACFLFARRYGRGVRRRCRMGYAVARNYWWQGQNALSEKQIGELLRFVC
jgi:hypothetical protein